MKSQSAEVLKQTLEQVDKSKWCDIIDQYIDNCIQIERMRWLKQWKGQLEEKLESGDLR